jgi:LEA14-like dessication related protein
MLSGEAIKSKAWLWAILLVIATFVILGLWQRSLILNYGKKGGSKPHVSVKQIIVHDIGEQRISMTGQIMVSNPLLVELKADRLQYQVFIDSIKILETEFVKPVKIKALDSIMMVLPLDLLTRPLLEILNQLEKNGTDSADYTIRSKVYFELPIVGKKTYVVNETHRAPAYRLLKLRIEDVDIEKFGFKNTDLGVSLVVENPNIFPMSMRDVDYDLTIGKDFHLEGKVKNVTHLPARSNIALPLKMDVHTQNLPRLAWQVLLEKKHTPYQINFRCKMVSADDSFKDTRFIVTQDGRLDEIKKLKKALPSEKDDE